ncbi:MAG: helix-turn-helix transcriptional regulator [Propioniciclava sp.]
MDAIDTAALELWGLERPRINEVAAYLRVSVSTIYEWRMKGDAPEAHRYGKHLTFAASDVRAWVDAHRESGAPSPADLRCLSGVARQANQANSVLLLRRHGSYIVKHCFCIPLHSRGVVARSCCPYQNSLIGSCP